MEKAPLIGTTKVLTSVERELIELQRDSDHEFYEDKIGSLEAIILRERDAKGEQA